MGAKIPNDSGIFDCMRTPTVLATLVAVVPFVVSERMLAPFSVESLILRLSSLRPTEGSTCSEPTVMRCPTTTAPLTPVFAFDPFAVRPKVGKLRDAFSVPKAPRSRASTKRLPKVRLP